MLALRCTRKVSGLSIASTTGTARIAAMTTAMVLSMALSSLHAELVEPVGSRRLDHLLEIVHFVELPHLYFGGLAFADWIREAARPLEGLVTVAHLDHGVARDEFLAFGERA